MVRSKLTYTPPNKGGIYKMRKRARLVREAKKLRSKKQYGYKLTAHDRFVLRFEEETTHVSHRRNHW